MPAATPTPGRLPGQPSEDPVLTDDCGQADDPWLDEPPGPPSGPDDDESGPPPWLADDPDDADDVLAWLDAELAKAAPWLAADPDWDDPAPTGPPGPAGPAEVFKAGRWDRSRGDGGGFAAGGLADRLPPGPVLAGLAADRWAAGLDQLTDDELIGVLRAARRLASWAAAMELAAATGLWRRRTAGEDAGDTGAALHADAELAAALTLTRHAADQLLGLAAALRRLPATRAALTAGAIDLPRATVIADELTGLTHQHAAAVEAAVTAAAPGQTTGQLRLATRRAVLAADPAAAQRRKEQALRQARVERWTEPAGTAALAGRDLPPAAVLAADANLTALAKQLKAAGAEGTLDTLRAQTYLALLSGTPPAALLPTNTSETCPPSTSSADTSSPPNGNDSTTDRATADSASDFPAAPSPDQRTGPGDPSGLRVTGRVNLTLPLTTWLGQSDTPGHVTGYGPLDVTDTRTLAAALAAQPSTQWCLTLTDPTGHSIAHGCAGTRPPPGHRRTRPGTRPPGEPHTDLGNEPTTGTGPPGKPESRPPGRPATGPLGGPSAMASSRPTTGTRDGPATGMLSKPATGPPPTPSTGTRDLPGARARPATWSFTLTPLTSGDCDHAWETPVYQPSVALRHLVNLRHATCVFPGCRRPATQCDADHTLAYHHGGKTCLCNLAPLCRHHHHVKQAPGWALEQTGSGTLIWTTPSGRRYTVGPTSYPIAPTN